MKRNTSKKGLLKRKKNQIYLDDFKTQFYGKLRKDNRWVKIAGLMPWVEIEERYAKNFTEKTGVEAINAQTVYICIVPTKEFQVRTCSKREWITHCISCCADKDSALKNWMERDALIGQKALRDAKNWGYPYLVVDGISGLEENFTFVEKVFKFPSNTPLAFHFLISQT